MAPRFNLKELRRRSLASFRTSRSTDTSSNDEPSSSSQELSSVGSITPPSLADESDPALHTQIPGETRYPHESNSNRFSVAESVASEPCSTKDLQDQLQSQQPLSQYTPRLTNITNKSTVSSNPTPSNLLSQYYPCLPGNTPLSCALLLRMVPSIISVNYDGLFATCAYSQVGISKSVARDWSHRARSAASD